MKYLVDSDFLVGLFREGDPHSDTTKKLLKKLKEKNETLMVPNVVLQETATVLSHKTGMEAVRLFYQTYQHRSI